MYEEKIIPNHTVADLFGNILNFGIGFFIDSITELLWNLTNTVKDTPQLIEPQGPGTSKLDWRYF